MATFRVGVGSFNINDGSVGIGTEGSGHGNLKVEGTLKASTNLDVPGVSTFTRYSGFNADNVSVNNRDLTLSGEYSTTGDIVVEDGASLTVGLGSTACVGTVECISVKNHFSVPVGDTEQRNETSGYGEGTVRYNIDLETMEFFNGNEWRQFRYQVDVSNSPSSRGRALLIAGDPLDGSMNNERIEFCNISTLGNTQHFGNLSSTSKRGAALAGHTRALHAAGTTPGQNATIYYMTIQSGGEGLNFGDLSGGRLGHAGYSSSTRGIYASGYLSGDLNVIEYVQIQTKGDAIDFGDATHTSHMANGFASPTRGVWHLGDITSPVPYGGVINFVTIASTGDAKDFGDMSNEGRDMSSCSNSVRGIFAGGRGTYPASKQISFVTIASTGNAVEFGNLSVGRWMAGQGASSNTRGIFMSGITGDGPSYSDFTNTIDYITIASQGDAIDFGDVAQKSYSGGGCSDSHGGLGGY